MPQRVDPGSYQSPEGERPAISTPIELAPRTHDPYAAFRFGDFSLFTAGNLLSITGRLMLAVAVEWEVYARTHSATALGLVGLVIVVPVVTLSLPAGHLADAVTWNNSVFQIGSVVGPALSGLLIAYIGFPFVYLVDALCAFCFFLLVLPIHRSTQRRDRSEAGTWKSLMAGLRFVFRRKVILATITLDLFAVLLGGATALMPIFADQILHCGPVGLGWMRAGPAVGAFAVALAVAHLPPMKQTGKTLLW